METLVQKKLSTTWHILKDEKYYINIEMDVIKFSDNTMVCGCITKITLIYGVVKLNFGIRLEYCIDCMWPIASSQLVDVFNCTAVKLVTYTACMCLNRSCTQYVCD